MTLFATGLVLDHWDIGTLSWNVTFRWLLKGEEILSFSFYQGLCLIKEWLFFRFVKFGLWSPPKNFQCTPFLRIWPSMILWFRCFIKPCWSQKFKTSSATSLFWAIVFPSLVGGGCFLCLTYNGRLVKSSKTIHTAFGWSAFEA